MHRLRGRLVETGEEHEKLGLARLKILEGKAGERAGVVDGMHDCPGKWENGHLLSLPGELVVGTPTSLRGAPGQDDERAELDDLMLAAVDDPELETRCTLVGSDYRITAEDDTGVGPRAK